MQYNKREQRSRCISAVSKLDAAGWRVSDVGHVCPAGQERPAASLYMVYRHQENARRGNRRALKGCVGRV